MTLHWGVDSFNPTNHPVQMPRNLLRPGEPSQQTLFDYVVRRAGTVPEFWGRYLGKPRPQLRPSEPSFIHDKNAEHNGSCKILLVYNGITPGSCQRRGRPGRQAGRDAAQSACEAAGTLLAPAGTRIYADLENWNASADWILGWWQTMRESTYAGMGGLYGNTGWHTWARGVPRTVTRRWGRGVAAAADQIEDEELEALMRADPNPALGHDFSRYVWSNRPWQRGDPPEGQMMPSSFDPVRPGGGTVTVIWQYRCDCFRLGGGRGLVDMDVATELGYREMWAPS